MTTCPLCASPHPSHFAEVRDRTYHRCPGCELTFLEPSQLPTPEEERAEYELHENDPGDSGYRKHLCQLIHPLVPLLRPKAVGLDFGCGPGPAIAPMLTEQGFSVKNYDPFFAPDEELLAQSYDFVVCTEVVEHFHYPGRDFAQLALILRSHGRLGIMTQMLVDGIDFAVWPYRREHSHVSFYRIQTMNWIAARFDWDLNVVSERVVIFSGRGER